jgi:hypothetical protein
VQPMSAAGGGSSSRTTTTPSSSSGGGSSNSSSSNSSSSSSSGSSSSGSSSCGSSSSSSGGYMAPLQRQPVAKHSRDSASAPCRTPTPKRTLAREAAAVVAADSWGTAEDQRAPKARRTRTASLVARFAINSALELG